MRTSDDRRGNRNSGKAVATPASARVPVQPDPSQVRLLREIDEQREKWQAFLKTRQDLTEDWLWQYWKPGSRISNSLQKKFMTVFGSSRLKNQRKVKSLVRNGIPPELRGEIWWACSGGAAKMARASLEERYDYLLCKIADLNDSHVAFEIEKDLMRTFPSHPWVQSVDGLDTLRRLLRAYAIRNPGIGYCQSMNYLAAMLLFHMPEERAYWAMCALIEDILPIDYYDPSMVGGRVDQQVLHSLIAWKLPQVHQVLRRTNTNLDPILCPWFLCLYINVLPIYAACRVWDCVFWEGNSVLFRVGLSMLKSKMAHLREAPDMMSIYLTLKSGAGGSTFGTFTLECGELDESLEGLEPSSTSRLIQNAFRKRVGVGALPRSQLERLRSKFREIIIQRDKEWKEGQEDNNTTSSSISNASNNESPSKAKTSNSTKKSTANQAKTDLIRRALETETQIHDLAQLAGDLNEGLDQEIEACVNDLGEDDDEGDEDHDE